MFHGLAAHLWVTCNLKKKQNCKFRQHKTRYHGCKKWSNGGVGHVTLHIVILLYHRTKNQTNCKRRFTGWKPSWLQVPAVQLWGCPFNFGGVRSTLGVTQKNHQNNSKQALSTIQGNSSVQFTSATNLKKLDPKWVPERAKHRGSKTWHEMKGPWHLSRLEQPKNYQPIFGKGVSYDARWWRSRWWFPITDPFWNVDINQVKSNDSSQISQIK